MTLLSIAFRASPLVLGLAAFALAACGSDDPSATGGTTTTTTTTTSGSGGSGGGGDTGSGGAGGSAPTAEPLTAPSETWTWIPFDDAFCASGQTTGIGVNLTDKSKNVVIYLMGGGACWDYLTCYQFQTAANLSGYTESKFQGDAQGLLDSKSLFDRADPTNPTKDYSYIFVPYCTGDIHGGNKVSTYQDKPTMHVGYANMTAYLKRIAATFPDAERVLLSGSSAGGYGAGVNWWQTVKAFPKSRVDMLDDCGPPLPNGDPASLNTWYTAWGLLDNLPKECADCQAGKLEALFPFYDQNSKGSRSALLAYMHDPTIASFWFPLDNNGKDKVAAGITELATQTDKLTSYRHYYVEAEKHVMLGDPASVSQNGVALKDWLTQMLSDDPAWDNVEP